MVVETFPLGLFVIVGVVGGVGAVDEAEVGGCLVILLAYRWVGGEGGLVGGEWGGT